MSDNWWNTTGGHDSLSFKAYEEAREASEDKRKEHLAKWQPIAQALALPEIEPLLNMMRDRLEALKLELEQCSIDEISLLRGRIKEVRFFLAIQSQATHELMKTHNRKG